MTELRHRLDGGLVGDIPDDLASAGVYRDELLRSRRLVFGEPPSAESDELTGWVAKAMTDAARDEDDHDLDNGRASAPVFGRWSDPAERDARTQFYIAYAYYRQGWGRVYSDDELFGKGLASVDKAIALAPGGRLVVDDANLLMRSADELRAELQSGLTREASDFNPLKVFRARK